MTVNEFMNKSCIPMHLKGYPYLQKAIEMSVSNPNLTMSQIYSLVSTNVDITYSNVERNIRTAISKGYPNMDEDIKRTLFYGKRTVSAAEYVKSVARGIATGLI